MENTKMELGKEYLFAGYKWVPVEINKDRQIAIMQSLGVTSGPWPGFSMSQFGNGNYYGKDITAQDISDYDDKTRDLAEQIKPVMSGEGLYLPSYENINDYLILIWKSTLARAANYGSSFGASDSCVWLDIVGGGDYAWYVNRYGNVHGNHQNNSCVVAPAFNLDLSKIKIEGDEIKVRMSKTSGSTEYYDESDGIECPTCKYEVTKNGDYPDERPNCGTKLIY